jgi:hypothetical protein
MTRLLLPTLIAALMAIACGDSDVDTPAEPEIVSLQFQPIDLQAGEELPWDCITLSLENESTLWVNTVEMTAGPAWHHSNWFFVPEDTYPGPDGQWGCSERGFDTLTTGLAGGVLFAQSTQATTDVQSFREGAAIRIPPRSVVVGQIHLLNASDAALTTDIRLDLTTLAEQDVDTTLIGMALEYTPLAIPPRQQSQFAGDCDFEGTYGGPLDFSLHYVMPHYHDLGTGLRIEAIGGARDGEVIFGADTRIGEPLSAPIEPAFDMADVTGLRFSCHFDNPRDDTVGWGIGDQEMCAFLAFTDGQLGWAGGVLRNDQAVGEDGGVSMHEGPCELYSFLPR